MRKERLKTYRCVKIDNQYFPIGCRLTSLESGRLVPADSNTHKDLIVGTVTEYGLDIRKL
jgi:hypothetical protein